MARRTGSALLVLSPLGVIVEGIFTLESMLLHSLGFFLAAATHVLSFLVAAVLPRRVPRWRRFGNWLLLGSPLTLALLVLFFATFNPTTSGAGRGVGGLVQRVLIIEVHARFVALGWLTFSRSSRSQTRRSQTCPSRKLSADKQTADLACFSGSKYRATIYVGASELGRTNLTTRKLCGACGIAPSDPSLCALQRGSIPQHRLRPQQHQVMLTLKGLPEGTRPCVGEMAERLQTKHHSPVELIDRLVAGGYVRRHRGGADRWEVLLTLAPKGENVLRKLSLQRRAELRRARSRSCYSFRTRHKT